MSDGYETEELVRIEAALDALVSPTSEDVFQATRPFDERAIASVAATRGGGGGGGGSSAVLLGPYIVNFDTPGVNNVPFFVPGAPEMADGFWITDTLVEFVTTWDDGSGPGFTMSYRLEVAPSSNANIGEWINLLDPYDGSGNIMDDAVASNLPAKKRQFRLDSTLWALEAGEAITTAKLAMEIYSNRDAFTVGQIRVWAFGVQT